MNIETEKGLNKKYNTINYKFKKSEMIINIPEKWDGKRAVMIIFGIGFSAGSYSKERMDLLREKIVSNNSALISFNLKEYINSCRDKGDFYSSEKIIKISTEIFKKFNKKFKDTKIDLIGWSYGAVSAFNISEKYSEIVGKTVFIVPSLNISAAWHASETEKRYNYMKKISEKKIQKSQRTFDLQSSRINYFEKYRGEIKIFLAEFENSANKQKIISDSEKFVNKNNATIETISKANHALNLHKAVQNVDVSEENRKIWLDFLSRLSAFLFE